MFYVIKKRASKNYFKGSSSTNSYVTRGGLNEWVDSVYDASQFGEREAKATLTKIRMGKLTDEKFNKETALDMVIVPVVTTYTEQEEIEYV